MGDGSCRFFQSMNIFQLYSGVDDQEGSDGGLRISTFGTEG